MQNVALFGNPVEHSKSLRIHQLFSKNTGRILNYKVLLTPLDSFEINLKHFFSLGSVGANITTPFKERALHCCDKLTTRARLAGAVNTIKRLDDNRLLGDNTDGVGIVSDLQRLGMISRGDKVLLLGAGGGARGAIFPLLELQCQLIISNRNHSKAKQLAGRFSQYGDISALEIAALSNQSMNLIINATTLSLQGKIPDLPRALVKNTTAFYDMYYQSQLTSFLFWAKQYGAENYADGLGMLVSQAAHAFQLWQGIMPNVNPVLEQLRQEFIQ